MGKKLFCYNCGKELTRSTNKREHIPAQCLFYGYSEEYKINRITVPCCLICNEEFSKIDQEIRDMIGIAKDEMTSEDNVTKKAVRSIMNKDTWKKRIEINEKGDANSVSFSYDAIIDINIKNFKGIFYYEFGQRLPEDYKMDVIVPGDEKYNNHGKFMYDLLLSENEGWEKSGHDEIFKYIIKGIQNDSDNNLMKTENLQQSIGLAAIIVYHNVFPFVILSRHSKHFK